MAKVIHRQEAIDDLNNIWEYIFEKWSERQADEYYTTIKMACNGTGQYPAYWKEYSDISRNLRGFKS